MSKIPVLEIFGPTIQGEGMVVGRKTMFVRTAGCDYQCNWCDSSFTWDGSAKEDIKQMTANEIVNQLFQIGEDRFDHVTISGGNPALLASLHDLVNLLKNQNVKIALETQGSKWQEWMKDVDDLTISPKPPSSGMLTDFTVLDQIIDNLDSKQISLKVVIFDDEDFNYAATVHERYKDQPLYLQVGNSDIYSEDDVALRQLLLEKYEWLIHKVVDSSLMNNVRVLPQLHTLVWGNKRGV